MSLSMSRRRWLATAAWACLGLYGCRRHTLGEQPNVSKSSRIRGTLWWVDAGMSEEDLREEVGFQHQVGFDLLWLTGTQHLMRTPAGTYALDVCLDEADRLGMKVLFETYTTPDWYARWNLSEEVSFNREFMPRVWGRYGHHESLSAWYIGHEIYLVWGEQSDYCRRLYRAIVECSKTISSRMRVCISPFFILDRDRVLGDFRFGEPAEYTQWWEATLKETGIDWLLLQDSGEHAAFTSIQEKEPFIAAYAEACKRARAEFWLNVEIAEHDVPDYQTQRLDRDKPFNEQRWRAVPEARLREKLALASKFSPSAVSWGWDWWRPTSERSAPERYQAFQVLNSGG